MATAPATSAPRSAERDATTQPDAERSSLKKPAPVTWGSLPHKGQLAILALVRVVDFFQMASLQAYMFYQLKSFAPGLPDSTISFQAGVLQGVFTSAQIATSIIWGRVADAPWAGRKFVLLVGLIGTGLSCVGVGYSKSFTTAAVFRMLGGASNGTVGAARTALAETVNKKYHPRAFLLLPLAFNIANILGPILGGLLADPVARYPGHLGPNSPLKDSKGVRHLIAYPYAPPNLLSAILLFLEAAIVWLGLRETLESRKYLRDRGLEVAGTIRYWFHRLRFLLCGYSSLSQEDGSGLDTGEYSPVGEMSMISSGNSSPAKPPPSRAKGKLPFRRIWTSNVLFVLLTIALFDFQMGGFASLWIVFLSSARSNPSSPKYKSPALPFHFTGGLAFPPSTTGFAMSILGIFGVILQFALYPRVNARFGLVRSFQYSLFIFPIAYFLAPYLALLPSTSEAPYQATGLWVWVGISVILFLQVAARTFALPTTIILLNNCSPHPSVLGTIHGLGSSVSSTFRTVGPIASGKWYAMGLEQGIIGLGWWGITIISLVGCVSGFLVKNGTGWEIKLPGEEEEEAREEKRSS